MQVSFGEYRLDLDARQLFKGTEPIRISPKAFLLLKLLLERRPNARSKAELHEAIWPTTFVSDTSLTQLVSEIRAAIGDDAHDPRFLRTVHGYGYAFGGEAVLRSVGIRDPQAIGVACWLHLENRAIPLEEGENVIGRDTAATVHLESLRISRYHARIVLRADEAVLEDLGSKNGTYLRGERLSSPARLKPGDDVRIGPFTLTFQKGRPAQTTEAEKS